jgi:hypothetical protein
LNKPKPENGDSKHSRSPYPQSRAVQIHLAIAFPMPVPTDLIQTVPLLDKLNFNDNEDLVPALTIQLLCWNVRLPEEKS